MKEIKRIGFIGAGNVAGHLSKALASAGLEILVIANRSSAGASELARVTGAVATTSIDDLHNYHLDLIIIAVPDNAIEHVSKELGRTRAAVVHTSGAAPTEKLDDDGRITGVFYPLQTLTKDSDIDMNEVPICLHSSNAVLLSGLQELARKITPLVYEVNDEQRQWLHLAAVLINNNINHLLAKVEDLISAQSIDRNILAPLLRETIRKAGSAHPGLHQTGPAIRGDESTKQTHLELLRKYGDDRLIELYTYFWRSIQQYKNHDISG